MNKVNEIYWDDQDENQEMETVQGVIDSEESSLALERDSPMNKLLQMLCI